MGSSTSSEGLTCDFFHNGPFSDECLEAQTLKHVVLAEWQDVYAPQATPFCLDDHQTLRTPWLSTR